MRALAAAECSLPLGYFPQLTGARSLGSAGRGWRSRRLALTISGFLVEFSVSSNEPFAAARGPAAGLVGIMLLLRYSFPGHASRRDIRAFAA